MTEAEFNQAVQAGNTEVIKPNQPQQTDDPQPPQIDMLQYMAVLQAMRSPRKHLTTAPTFVPKSFVDQIQLYDDGTHRRTYFYFNGTWSYVTLT